MGIETTEIDDNINKSAECTLSNGSPCLPCVRQLKLQARIEETEKLLDRLIAEEEALQTEINASHDPLRRLPIEIISHIFLLTLPDFENLENVVAAKSEPGVLTLGAVCQQWRKVAWSTPRLWSNVMLLLSEVPTANMIQVVQEWLQRSRNLRLSIRLSLLFLFERVPLKGDRALSFITLFNKHSKRWQDLSILADNRLFPHFERPKGSYTLKSLELIPCMEDPELVFQFSGTKPQPEHITAISFENLKGIGISWNNATNVTVGALSLDDCIQLLRVAPKLVNLRIKDMRNHPIPIPQMPLTFPRLQTLYVSESGHHSDGSVGIKAMLDSITLPSLEGLSIEADSLYFNPISFPFNNIVELLKRSSCSLISFSLGRIRCHRQEIFNILYSLPSVRHVQLDIRPPNAEGEDHDLPILFNHLSRSPSTTGGMPSQSDILPNLETFKYHVSKGTQIPWALLPSIARPVSGQRRPFKTLTIIERPRPPRSVYGWMRPKSHLPPRPPQSNPSLMLTKSENINRNTIHDFLSLQEDGIDLCFPHKVSRETLLALLEDE